METQTVRIARYIQNLSTYYSHLIHLEIENDSPVRVIYFNDLTEAFNKLESCEHQIRTISNICQDNLGLRTIRTARGFAVIVDDGAIDAFMQGVAIAEDQAASKEEPDMESANQRIAHQNRRLSANGRKRMEMVFGDLDLPITDIMWLLGCKFLNDVPDWVC